MVLESVAFKWTISKKCWISCQFLTQWQKIATVVTSQLLSQWCNCCRSRKCIWCHIPMHAFCHFFPYLSYLDHLSLLGLQTKTRRSSNSSAFSSFKSYNPETLMSSTAFSSVRLVRKCLPKKWLKGKKYYYVPSCSSVDIRPEKHDFSWKVVCDS